MGLAALAQAGASGAAFRRRPSAGHYRNSWTRTLATPLLTIPILRAAFNERSIILPRANGPRSFILTTTVLPLFRLVTLTLLPNGSVLWAAVSLPWA